MKCPPQGQTGRIAVGTITTSLKSPAATHLPAVSLPHPSMPSRRCFFSLLLAAALPVGAAETVVSTLTLEELAGATAWPEPLRQLMAYALGLTKRKLGYHFGSADPEQAGMDCSGTIHHLLSHARLKHVPRQSDAFYKWVRDACNLTAVTGMPSLTDPVLDQLKPGHLLFWTGTYDTGVRTLPVSHVMIYLGKTTDGRPVMFGASDGRPYRGKRHNGVSVFDFRLPSGTTKSRFVGYGPPPGLDLSEVRPVPPG